MEGIEYFPVWLVLSVQRVMYSALALFGMKDGSITAGAEHSSNGCILVQLKV